MISSMQSKPTPSFKFQNRERTKNIWPININIIIACIVQCAQLTLKHGSIIIAEHNQAWLPTGSIVSDPTTLWTCYVLCIARTWETHKHKAAKIAVCLFPIAVAIVLWPAAASASQSTKAAKACPPTIQKLCIITLRGTSEINDPDKLNPKNHIRKSMHPLERESRTGISLIRRGGDEYCQIMNTRRTVAMMLSRHWVARADNNTMIVEK